MFRHSFALKVRKGEIASFRKGLGTIWKKLVEILDRNKINNFSMWTVEDVVFGYYESQEKTNLSETDRSCIVSWDNEYGKYFDWISRPFEEMRLMYHDFGIVRESKELIRHRVFVTKLIPGAEEEYKKRHDLLIKIRNNQLNKGPDSNFSIWSAGGYIFGYNEIDVTMEKDKTEEDINLEIEWETKMLEIMSWLTNDVDWITGEHHQSIRRLCYHN